MVDLRLGEPLGESVFSEDLFLWHIPQFLCEIPHRDTANPFKMPKYSTLWSGKCNWRAKIYHLVFPKLEN
jgi:hypothetical protein